MVEIKQCTGNLPIAFEPPLFRMDVWLCQTVISNEYLRHLAS